MAKRISSLSVVLGATVKPFVSAFSGAKATITGFVGTLKSAGASILKFTGIAGGLGAVFGALKGAASGITLAAELEQVGVAFETMLGSASAAKALMDELTTFSAATPFEFPEIAASAKKLLAFGVGAKDMTGKLTMLGDIAAGIGAPLEDIAAIYGKIKSRGQLTGETLNQMAERGIPIYRALAKQMGVAETEVAGLVTKGAIGFKDVDAALAGLSGTGGQFAGMMAKQSQTMAGLWSTLTDTIGLTMAGLVTTLVEAFGLRDAMKALTAGLGRIGSTLTGAVKSYAPIVVGWMKSAWSVITSTWTNIVAFVAPIITSLVNIVAKTWQSNVSTTAALLSGLWSIVKGVFTFVRDIVVSVATGLVTAWNWAMNALGLESLTTASTVGGAFQGLVEWAHWLQRGIATAFAVMGYTLQNWRLALDIAVTQATLGIVTFANQVTYFFGEVIPAIVRWLAQNWQKILVDMAMLTGTIFKNIATNIVSIVSNIPGLISGSVSFSDLWTPLTDGFEATLSELPQIIDRQAGPMEAALAQNLAGLKSEYATGLSDMLKAQDKTAKDAVNTVAGMFSTISGAIVPPVIPTPEMPPVQMVVEADTSAVKAVGDAAKESSDQLKAMFAGSAEAQQAKYAAKFASMVMPMNRGAASVSGAAATPVAASASRGMRDTGGEKQLLEQIAAESKEQNNVLRDILEATENQANGLEEAEL
jgi:tape measure domain-containing protein